PAAPSKSAGSSPRRRNGAGVAARPVEATDGMAELLQQYECGPLRFAGDPNASYERHLIFDHVVESKAANTRERFEAVARSLRDLLTQRWLKTMRTHDAETPKRVYYLSMEFLIGRSLTNNVTNLMVEPVAREVVRREGLDIMEL